MDVQVITQPAFAVIGIEGCGPSHKGPEWIGPLWDQAFSQVHEIQHLIKKDVWGLMSDVNQYLARWMESGKYLAGWELKQDCEPVQNWTIWQIPETIYATIPCIMQTYQDVMHYVDNVFLKAGEYEPAGVVHEYYPPGFSNPATDTLYLYFTVKKS